MLFFGKSNRVGGKDIDNRPAQELAPERDDYQRRVQEHQRQLEVAAEEQEFLHRLGLEQQRQLVLSGQLLELQLHNAKRNAALLNKWERQTERFEGMLDEWESSGLDGKS